MEPFLAVLYIHVIATLALVAAMTAEGLALRHLRRASTGVDPALRVDPVPGMRPLASICLATLFFSGGYLADHASLWRMAWPKIAVAVMTAFGALAGLSSRTLRRIRHRHEQHDISDAGMIRDLRSPFLKVSLSIRTGLLLAAVLLMTAKPGAFGSVGIVLAFILVFWALAALKPHTPARRVAVTKLKEDIARGE